MTIKELKHSTKHKKKIQRKKERTENSLDQDLDCDQTEVKSLRFLLHPLEIFAFSK